MFPSNPSPNFSHKLQQCRFCSGLLSFGLSPRLFWGKIKAKNLMKTGCVEVKKKAQISHRILTGGGSFPCFERTAQLKLFAQADSHHLSYWSRSTILFLAWDDRPSQRQTNDRLETVPACSGCRVSISWLGQSHRAGGRDDPRCCLYYTNQRKVGAAFHYDLNFKVQGLKWDICSSAVGPAARLRNRSQLIYSVSSIPSSFMRRTNSWRRSGNPSLLLRMDEEVMLGEDKRLPDLTYKDISSLWLINCFFLGGGLRMNFHARGSEEVTWQHGPTQHRAMLCLNLNVTPAERAMRWEQHSSAFGKSVTRFLAFLLGQ